MRVDDHEHNERQHEHDREHDGDAVEVLLDDARAGLAIISEIPVPLPECNRMNTMRPTPETTSRMSVMMRSGFKVGLFFRSK